MEWNANLLPDDPAKWQGTNATITGNTITLNTNGEAKTTLFRDDLDYLPDFLQVTVTYKTSQSFSNYEPHFWAKIDIVDANDEHYIYIALMNQMSLVTQNTWFVQTVVDIADVDIKYLTFSLYVDNEITQPVVITQRELRTSVALSKPQQDAISTQLPSMVVFSNTTQTDVTSTLATALVCNFQLSASSNLLLHLILSGVATEDCEITISFMINNTEVSYTPMKHRIQAGNFLIGIPGSLLQVEKGTNVFALRMSCSSGTLTFARNGIYGSLDGKNILGGHSSEVPHIEIVQPITYLNVKGNYNIQTIVQAYMDTLYNNTLTQPITYQNVVGSKEVTAIPSVEVTRVAVQENYMDDGTTVRYDHDEYIILDGSMHFKSSVIQETLYLISLTDTGAIHGIDLDNTNIKNYDAFTIVPLGTVDQFITTWNMTSGEFTLLTQEGTYNATIDWGDGTSSTHTTGNPTHTYASAGQYQIKISGQYNGLRINNNAIEKDKLIAVNQWGNVGFTSFERAFYGCSNLVSLPKGSITGAEGVESFYYCFYDCTSLTTIPNGLFDFCVNVTTFSFCFSGCTSLTTIPTDLFKYTANVTSFHSCFRGCTSLATIPNSLFDFCVNVESFYACFYTCISLTTIPVDLFRYNVNVKTFGHCFRGCTSLTTIPNDLFKYNVNVESFYTCFYECKNLALPTSIFNLSALQAKQPDMSYCFRPASTADSPTGTVQPIWEYVTITARNYCFQRCTALDNYSQIPKLWR